MRKKIIINILAIFFFSLQLNTSAFGLDVFKSQAYDLSKQANSNFLFISYFKKSKNSNPIYYKINFPERRIDLPIALIKRDVGWYKARKRPLHPLKPVSKNIFDTMIPLGKFQGKKLLKLFKKDHIYSYVIDEDSIVIAETREEDQTLRRHSKHIVLSKFSDKVRYAGELWRNKKGITIDNNSGTYKPKREYLPTLSAYLAFIFDFKVSFKEKY